MILTLKLCLKTMKDFKRIDFFRFKEKLGNFYFLKATKSSKYITLSYYAIDAILLMYSTRNILYIGLKMFRY